MDWICFDFSLMKGPSDSPGFGVELCGPAVAERQQAILGRGWCNHQVAASCNPSDWKQARRCDCWAVSLQGGAMGATDHNKRVAIVGSGITGLSAAWLLHRFANSHACVLHSFRKVQCFPRIGRLLVGNLHRLPFSCICGLASARPWSRA